MIFDTDVFIWLFRGKSEAAEFIQAQPDRAVSIVSLMELFQGAKSHVEIRHIRSFFQHNRFRIIPLNERISHLAATLMEDHTLKDGLQLADALIAATAREWDEQLATGNVRHFRTIAGLELKAFRSPG